MKKKKTGNTDYRKGGAVGMMITISDNMKKKKWTSEENKLASMLAWVCCHADEDCPSEYRTKHFREHLKEAVDYLENSGWYDYNQQAGSK